jgi:hypothetical protein
MPGGDVAPGWGWSFYILPYIEQDSLYRTQLNLSQSVADSALLGQKVKLYVCPSDIQAELFPLRGPGGTILTTTGGAPLLAAPSSYAAIVGGDETEVTVGDEFGVFHGCFFRNSRVRITDITDGTSHTGLVAERACGITQGTWAGAITGARMRLGAANPAFVLNPDQDYDPDLFGLVHTNWINAGTDQSDDGGTDDSSSFHAGGAYHLFGDGSVRFLKNTTGYRGAAPTPDRLAYWAIGTRADGDFPSAIEN